MCLFELIFVVLCIRVTSLEEHLIEDYSLYLGIYVGIPWDLVSNKYSHL